MTEDDRTKTRVVWMNGELVPETEAKVSIYDSALMFGDMVFEMTRSFNKEQFKLREHIERMFAGIKILRIPLKMSIAEMEDAVQATVQANDPLFRDDDEHRIMIDVSRGLLGIYQGVVGTHTGPNVIIADFPLRWTVAGMGKLFRKGINAVVPSQRAIPSQLLETKIKNRSRIHYMMANIEVGRFAGEDNWALLLDTDGFIAEGTGDNFFMVKNGQIITPEGRNVLRGVSRAYIMDIVVPALGMEVVETNIEPYDVYNADEAFLTGTPFCMLPMTSFNGVKISNGEVGPVFQKLLQQWGGNVGLDIQAQIDAWDGDANTAATVTPYQFKSED